MNGSCAQCGSALPAKAKRCGRCGAQAIAAGGGSYGLVDLDAAGGQTVGSLALDVEPPKPRKQVARTPGGSSSTGSTATKHASGTRSAVAKPKAPAQPQGDPAAGMADRGAGRGLVLGDDPLAEGYGQSEHGSLDIEEAADPRRARQAAKAAAAAAEAPPPPRELTADEKRALEIEQLAEYGKPPAQIVGTMAYCVKVTLRKRVLETELLSLSAQRKRTDDAARDAQAKLGEALFAKRKDPRLTTLAKQIQAVGVADQAIGSVEKTGQKKKQSIEAERSQLDTDIRNAEADASPLRLMEAQVLARVEELKMRAKQADALRKRIEQELEAARKKPGADPMMLERLKAERDAAHGEVQTLGVEVGPLEDDLSVVRRDLAVHLRKLTALQQEQASAATALERAQQNHRVSTGSAHGARRDALSALAQMAIESGLAAIAQSELQAVNEAVDRRDRKRSEEELLRAATSSFDETAYKQGMMLLVGGLGAMFLSLIAVVIF
jgi:hypothetical protein